MGWSAFTPGRGASVNLLRRQLGVRSPTSGTISPALPTNKASPVLPYAQKHSAQPPSSPLLPCLSASDECAQPALIFSKTNFNHRSWFVENTHRITAAFLTPSALGTLVCEVHAQRLVRTAIVHATKRMACIYPRRLSSSLIGIIA